MYTINIYLRLALIVLGLGGGIALWAAFGIWYGIWFVILGLVMLATYILLGTVQSAAMKMQGSDFIGAEQRLKLTLTPRLLYPSNRAYFYMIKGSVAMARKDTEEGEQWLRKAQNIKLPTDNERAMLELQLANIMASRGKWKQAKIHYRNTKNLKITESHLKDQLKQFEKALTNRGQMKAAQRQGGGMRSGGKRRRPKMK